MPLVLNGTTGVQDNSGAFVAGTAVATTSGTSVDFTGIPSWVKRVTVMLNGVSTNGTSLVQIQLGDSGGIETTGYSSCIIWAGGSNEVGGGTGTTGVLAALAIGGGVDLFGSVTFNLFGSNTWLATGILGYDIITLSPYVLTTVGGKTLSATLDRVRLTTVNGTDTFDAGSVNILYE
jgi:hypothetical protein